ncbi:hypothetical protein [Streptomyces sp. NPDC058613]|uniref:hypothetical protein n=1 Tax=Streptomyces sp. NPDC058613 TaxID=3346556 RepID=UPI00365A115F
MTIRFVSGVGADTGLLDSAITHYQGLGVDAFHIARHIESFDDPDFRRSQDVVARHDISFAAVHQGPWDEDLNGYLIWAQMRRHPTDWWVIADLDEFHVYDRPLTDVIAACEAGGYDHVKGALLDRVAADGSLAALEPNASIWAQYPLAGFVTLRLPGGDWHLTYPDTVDESRRMLQHLEANGGRIDVTAEELSLHRCGSDYSDYEAWPELVSRLKDIR